MNDFKTKSRVTFDSQAETYDYKVYGEHARKLYQPISERLEKIQYDSILDIGCGTGAILKKLLEQNHTIDAYGIDLSSNMIEVAKRKLNGSANLLVGDAENLPYNAHSFDVVMCTDSFHHYPDPDRVIREIYRVLCTRGTLILSDCYQPTVSRFIMNLFMKYSKEGDIKIYSKNEIERLFHQNNFSTFSWGRVNNTSFIAIGKKE